LKFVEYLTLIRRDENERYLRLIRNGALWLISVYLTGHALAAHQLGRLP
jgi:hypothetical protein